MLASLRIQNFRSIRDASVKLGQVNLFIGPNNSGKSNFLKGISLLTRRVEQYVEPNRYRKIEKGEQETLTFLKKNISRILLNNSKDEQWIEFNVVDSTPEGQLANAIVRIRENQNKVIEMLFNLDESETKSNFSIATSNGQIQDFANFQKNVSQIIVHKINAETFQFGIPNSTENRLASDGANIISYLFI